MSFEFLLNISTFMVCICSRRRPNFLLPRRGSWLFVWITDPVCRCFLVRPQRVRLDYVKFWKGINGLLPAATDVTFLVLFSDRLSSGPPCEAWDAMNLPSLTSLKLESFIFSDRAAFGGVNTGLRGFLQRHLTASSRLSEVVLYRCSSTYGRDLVWAMV